jgi:hypothetical protein
LNFISLFSIVSSSTFFSGENILNLIS